MKSTLPNRFKAGLFTMVFSHGIAFALLVFYTLSNTATASPIITLLGGSLLYLATAVASIFVVKSYRNENSEIYKFLSERLQNEPALNEFDAESNQSVIQLIRILDENRQDFSENLEERSMQISQKNREILNYNRDLSTGLGEQSSQLGDTASNFEEISNNLNKTNQQAEMGEELVKKARKYANSGSEIVVEAISSMKDMNAESQKISDIINVIDDIAFQTNLLALNAAVEAARAGEQGRGFAVVASEVRNLAQRCSESAQEIKLLIEGSQVTVKKSSKLVNESDESLKKIVSVITELNDLISNISHTSKQQYQGVNQANKAVKKLGMISQNNIDLGNEVTDCSEQLHGIVESLQNVVTGSDRSSSNIQDRDNYIDRGERVERRSEDRPWSQVTENPKSESTESYEEIELDKASGYS